MKSSLEVLAFFYNMQIWLRAFIILFVVLFILLPILIWIAKKLLPLSVILIRYLLKIIYILTSWIILNPLHKSIGRIFGKINNQFTLLVGEIDLKLKEASRFSREIKKRFIGTRIILLILLTSLIGLPVLTELHEDSPIFFVRYAYLNIEEKIFGSPPNEPYSSPAMVKTLTPTENITPEPLLVIKVKNGVTLHLREKANSKSEVVDYLHDDIIIYFIEEKTSSYGTVWVHVITEAGDEGWANKKYFETFFH